MSIAGLIPRRAAGLPPGQREVREFPRFSDKPLRWAPPTTSVELAIEVEGELCQTVSADDLAQFEHIEQVSDFHCVTTWTHRGARWGGARFGEVVRAAVRVAIDGELPPHLVAHAADRQSAIFMTDDLLADDVLLATHLNGQPLGRKHGAPLRLVSPSQYGYKSVKHLIGLDFRAAEPASTLGPKEHLRGRVALEERHSSLPNWAVRVPYRLTIIPTALASERGLRTSPK